MNNSNKSKLIILGFVIILLLLVGYIITTSMSRSGKLSLNVTIFPSTAAVTVDGKSSTKGKLYLSPGTHTITASQTGFDASTKQVYVEKSDQTTVLVLNPVSDSAKLWVANHQAEYNNVSGAGELEAKELSTTFNSKNPITKYLPYKTFMYSIGYRNDKSDPSGMSIILTIDAPEGYRQAALYRIRQLGYDPTNFTINFNDYENPFSL